MEDSNEVGNNIANTNAADQNETQRVKDIFALMAEKIIEQQESIIGSIAIEQAQLVQDLQIDWTSHLVNITGNGQAAVDNLVEKYKELFGQIAVETCKEAVARYLAQLPPDKLPKSLQ